MRKLLAIVRNEIQREFASPVSFVFFLILPLIFTAAVGAGLGGMMDSDSDPTEFSTTVYYVAPEDDPLADAFIDALEQANLKTVRLQSIPEDEIDEIFSLHIPDDITPRTEAGETVTVTLRTLSSSSSSFAVKQAVQAAQTRVGAAVLVIQSASQRTGSHDTSETYTLMLEQTLDAAANPRVVPETVWSSESVYSEASTTASATSKEQASAGQIVTWVQITLLGASEVFVNERQNGTFRRLLISPMRRSAVLLSKIASRLILGLIQMTILLVGGALLFGVEWGSHPFAVALVSLAFAMATVSLGTLLATLVRTHSQASSVTIGCSMAFAALGGAWFPLEITPLLFRQVVQILPSTWAMKAYTHLLTDASATVASILPYAGVLLGFTALFIVIAGLRFNRLEN